MTSNKFVSVTNSNTSSSGDVGYDLGSSYHAPDSPERQQQLASYARGIVTEDISIKVDPNARTASITMGDDSPTITIPAYGSTEANSITNPFDELEDDVFYAMIQYANLLHELGHYLYTDDPTISQKWDDFIEQNLSNIPPVKKQQIIRFIKQILNAIEDGGVENSLKEDLRSNAAHRLAFKNETFIASAMERPTRDDPKELTLPEALSAAAMDLAKCNTGTLRRLLDENDPTVQFASDDAKSQFFDFYNDYQSQILDCTITADPEYRAIKIFDLLDDVYELVFDAPDDQLDQATEDFSDDSDQNVVENDSGEAQQQSNGLDQVSKKEKGQEHAKITQQSVTITSDGTDDDENNTDEDTNGEPSDSDDESNDTTQSEAGNESDKTNNTTNEPDASDTEESQSPDPQRSGTDKENKNGVNDNQQTSENPANDGEDGNHNASNKENQGGSNSNNESRQQTNQSNDENTSCPQCFSTDITENTQSTDPITAARSTPPFDPHADWIGSVEFVSNDELFGFRIQETTNDSIPKDSIENNRYKVDRINSQTVEVLELRSNYDDPASVTGYICNNCGHEWVPTINGG